MLGKIHRRIARYRRQGWLRTSRIALDTLVLSGLQRIYGFDHWHAHSPTSARSYRQALAALVNDLGQSVVVEVGCGLGGVLARTTAPERVGYDVDAGAIRAARLLRDRSITFRQGGFPEVEEAAIGVLIAVNWPHDFSPEQLEKWIMPLLPRTRYLLVDRIDRSSPLKYDYFHDFAFLAGHADAIKVESLGEDHRHFMLFEVCK